MMLDPEDFFRFLIDYRKEIKAPEVHIEYTLKPYRFVIYNPANCRAAYHFMPCATIRTAQNNGTIMNLRRTSSYSGMFRMYGALPARLTVCNNCIGEWNRRFPGIHLDAQTFDLAKFFLLGEYYPDVWDGISIPPEIDENEFMPNCFLLYKPVRNSVFHFMKCKTVCDDIKIGWIKSYRFTDRTSGVFDLYGGSAQKLRPCEQCLTEWNNGAGWKNYSSSSDNVKKIIRANFSIEEFFHYCNQQEQRPSELSELYELMNDNYVWFGANISNDYPQNWTEITNMYRASRNYRCEECGVDLSGHPELAVTHHINGSHPDVSPDNMKVLCIWCHSKQPYHVHTVKFTRPQYNQLRKLRSEQGIKMSDIS